jgi:hypothetical protein
MEPNASYRSPMLTLSGYVSHCLTTFPPTTTQSQSPISYLVFCFGCITDFPDAMPFSDGAGI